MNALQLHWLALGAVIVVLFIVNLLNNRWARSHYMLVCFIATIVLLGIARIDELTWAQLGLARNTWRAGFWWSVGVFGAVVLFYAVAASIPVARRGFNDKRAAEKGWANVLYHSTIRIPFGTAVLEETAFRGVLLAIVYVSWGWWVAVIVSSLLFGLWHILPALEFHESSEVAGLMGEGKNARLGSVVANVFGTAVGGVGFCILRGMSGSLLPPIVLHASLNGIGLAVSWAFARRMLRRL
jgi:uncharacterized protein